MKIGIIICDRYKSCAGGKCFRSMQERTGAFSIYSEAENLEVVGYTSCGGCPGGNIEYAIAEMLKNGAAAIHLATGFVVGYPPCPYIDHFRNFIEQKYDLPVVIGTHPIPQKYYKIHQKMGTWNEKNWQELIAPSLASESIRLKYD